MPKYICIIGWARGGTTLAKNLFSCFNDTWITPEGEGPNFKFFEGGGKLTALLRAI